MAHAAFYDDFAPRLWIAGAPQRIAYGEFISFASENKCHYLERLWYGEDSQNVVVADGSFHPGQFVHVWLLKVGFCMDCNIFI